MPQPTFEPVAASFGRGTRAKLSNVAIDGEPEEQLRAPLEAFVASLVGLCGLPDGAVALVGETPIPDLQTRPDYAVLLRGALAGFFELKAPARGPTRATSTAATPLSGPSCNRCTT